MKFNTVIMGAALAGFASGACVEQWQMFSDSDCTQDMIKTDIGSYQWNNAHDSCIKSGHMYYQVTCDENKVTQRWYHDAECLHERTLTKSYKFNECQPIG